MITKILPLVVIISVFYIGSIYSSKNLSKKLEKKSKIFHDPVIDNYLKAFQSILDLGNLKVFVLNEKQKPVNCPSQVLIGKLLNNCQSQGRGKFLIFCQASCLNF